jgi:hypothetical protein
VKVPIKPENRYVVHDNDSPCDGCGRVTEVALIDVNGGWPTVECDQCAPELAGTA